MSLTLTAGVLVLVAAVGTGCAQLLGPERVVPAGPPGPQLVIEVESHSDRDVELGYDFEAAALSGGGAGSVTACSRQSIGFGQIAGTYRILVEGMPIIEGVVAEDVPRDGFFVIRLAVAPNGRAEVVAPPEWTRIRPQMDDALFEDCG